MNYISMLARAQKNEARFKRRVAERMKTRIRLACDGDRPVERGKYKVWQFVMWGKTGAGNETY